MRSHTSFFSTALLVLTRPCKLALKPSCLLHLVKKVVGRSLSSRPDIRGATLREVRSSWPVLPSEHFHGRLSARDWGRGNFCITWNKISTYTSLRTLLCASLVRNWCMWLIHMHSRVSTCTTSWSKNDWMG